MGVGTNGVGLGPGRTDGDTLGAGGRAATRGEGRGAVAGPVARPAENEGASSKAEEAGTPKMGGMPGMDRDCAGTVG